MMKKIIFLAVFILGTLNLRAQTDTFKPGLNVGIGMVDNARPLNYSNFYTNYRLDIYYNINPRLSIGAYAGSAGIKNINYFSSEVQSPKQGYYYGALGYYHFADLLFKNTPKLDLYLKAKVGIANEKNLGETVYQQYFDYGAYLGGSYRINDWFGIHAEAGLGTSSFVQIGLLFYFNQ